MKSDAFTILGVKKQFDDVTMTQKDTMPSA